jgi:hypothetical protein
MSHPSAGPVRPTPPALDLLCRSCHVHWVFTGQVPHRPRPWHVDAVLLLGLVVTAVAVLLHHRDVGAALAALVCAATAVMVLRDRARRCSGCVALQGPSSDVAPTLASVPAPVLPAQRRSRT